MMKLEPPIYGINDHDADILYQYTVTLINAAYKARFNLEDWLDDNNIDHDYIVNRMDIIYMFTNEEDAMLFELMWTGSDF